jgi:hypothetical protein
MLTYDHHKIRPQTYLDGLLGDRPGQASKLCASPSLS